MRRQISEIGRKHGCSGAWTMGMRDEWVRWRLPFILEPRWHLPEAVISAMCTPTSVWKVAKWPNWSLRLRSSGWSRFVLLTRMAGLDEIKGFEMGADIADKG